MNLRQRTGTSSRPLRFETLEQRRLLVASLDVQATINTVNANTPPGIVLDDGASAATSYKVTNTGNVVLSDVSVVDDNGTATPDDDIVPLPKLTVQQPQGTLLGTYAETFAHSFLMHPTLPYMYASVEGEVFNESKLLVYNTQTLSVTTLNTGYREPTYLALSPDGSRLYFGEVGGIGVMNTATLTMLPSLDGWAYNGLNVGADGRLLVHWIGKIEQLSPNTGAEVAPAITLPNGDFYYGFSQVSPDKTRLYYLSNPYSTSTLNQLDLTTEPPTRLWRHEIGGEGLDIALSSDGAYVSFLSIPRGADTLGVVKYRTSDMSVVGTFNTSGYATEMVYSPDGQIAYIASATGKIGIWDANTFQKLGDIPVASGEPVEMQVDASGKYLFVSVDGPTDSLRIYSTGRGGVHNVGDLNGNLRLDPAEAWTFQATITAREGQNVHVATVTAKTPDSNTVSDTDPSHYLVYPTWEAAGSVAEKISGAVIGAIPDHPWTGGWALSDFRFEVAQGNLRLKAGSSLTAAADDGLVVEFYTFEAVPKRLGQYTVAVSPNALPWHRVGESRDVDGNGVILPIDALMIINHLNLVGVGPLQARPANSNGMIDVDGDGQALAVDALIVINYLNANPIPPNLMGGELAEGEAADTAPAGLSLLLTPDETPLGRPVWSDAEDAPPHVDSRGYAVAADWIFAISAADPFTPDNKRARRGDSGAQLQPLSVDGDWIVQTAN